METIKDKRNEMAKAAWIKNVMRIYPEKTLEETEVLWDKIHPEAVEDEDVKQAQKVMHERRHYDD